MVTTPLNYYLEVQLHWYSYTDAYYVESGLGSLLQLVEFWVLQENSIY